MCAYHPQVSEQAEAAQDASRDDHDYQSNQQSCAHSRETPGLLLYWHRWLQRRGHNRSCRYNQVTRLWHLGSGSALGCVKSVWQRGAWVDGRFKRSRWQIGRGGRLHV